MRDADQGLLLDLIERAFVVALGAVELALALADDGDVDRQGLRRLAFPQAGDAEQQYQPATIRFIAAETYAYATVRPHGASAFCMFVAPNKLCFDGARQAGGQIALTIGQAACGRGGRCRRASVVIRHGGGLSMDLAGHSQR